MKKAPKAYKNIDFLNSPESRTLRILAEYIEPEKRFREQGIKHTIAFFGSARIRPGRNNNTEQSEFYHSAEELAFKLSSWGKNRKAGKNSFAICSGGGDGIMEAANRGAQRAEAKNIGLNISLPFEQEPNKYITPSLNFEFHYFFMRKLWFLSLAEALVVFPGGFGTMDELFETLTLIQTRKLERNDIPVLLYNRSFWEDMINFKKLVDLNFISKQDLNLFKFFETADEGFKLLKSRLTKIGY